MKITRRVQLFDKIGYSHGTIIGLGQSKRGVFIRRDSGDVTYAHNDTHGKFWKLIEPLSQCIDIPVEYDLVKQRWREKNMPKPIDTFKADCIVFLPTGRTLQALALYKNNVVAKQASCSGEWFENSVNQYQLKRELFVKLPVAERLKDYVNFK